VDKYYGNEAVVKNYGVASYSPVIYYLQLKEIIAKFKPTHVFLLLYPNDCNYDSLYLLKARYSKTGELLAIPGPSKNIFVSNLRKLYVARYIKMVYLKLKYITMNLGKTKKIVDGIVEEEPIITDVTASYIYKIAEKLKNNGTRFVLMTVPSKYNLAKKITDPNEFSKKWESWAKKNSIDFIDLTESFKKAYRENGQKLFFDGNIHFNEAGHSIVAEEIIKYLNTYKFKKSP